MNHEQVIKAIVARMKAEDAKDFSEGEIVRCLQNCVSGNKLIAIALKEFSA